MTEHARWSVISSAGPQPPKDQIRSIRSGKQSQPIDAAVLANPVPGTHMVVSLVRRIAKPSGLFCREVTALLLSDIKELALAFGGLHTSSTFLNHYVASFGVSQQLHIRVYGAVSASQESHAWGEAGMLI